ncbi:MAG: immunity 26/phosphotriesterase HocA family protein [Lachnospiraceae bacterium]|jgi:hypothetical protein|nr:immunity 26/phosphotriesterase HocA family protein [Lachnospiraceae bacterium]
MSKIKIWGWNKKKRTMIRYIKPGDIFCFELSEQKYCFGRIIAKTIVGHIAEIFDYISSDTIIDTEIIEKSSRLMPLIILDSYTLFDYKISGDWRIIGHQENYTPNDVNGIYFSYGTGEECKKVDVFGNETSIPESDKNNYTWLAPQCNEYIKELVLKHLEN